MCDDAKNKNNGDKTYDNVHVNEAEPTSVSSLSVIVAFDAVRIFIYTQEILENYQKK